MRKIALTLIGMAAATSAFGQVEISEAMRFDLEPNSIYLQNLNRFNEAFTDETIRPLSLGANAVQQKVPVAVTLADGQSVEALEAAGLQVVAVQDNYVFGNVAIADVEAVAATQGVEWIELTRVARKLNDKSRAETRVDDVHAGADLPASYTGRGVLVGLMDGGLDPNHINFKTSDLSQSRVKRIWKYSSYGSETSYTTDSKIASFTTDDAQETHGTHVLGTMAGAYDTGVADKHLYGVATGADIAIGCGAATEASVVKAVQRISEYAASQNMPCVINLSLGINSGPHDGSDSFCKSLSNLGADPNVTICIAAGNEGDLGCAVSTKFSILNKTLRTMIAPNYTLEYYYPTNNLQIYDKIEVWSNDDTPFDVKVVVVDSQTGDTYGGVDVTTSNRSTSFSSTEGFKAYYSSGTMKAYKGVSSQNNRYYAMLDFSNVVSKSSTAFNRYYVGLIITGSNGQRIDVYSDNAFQQFVSKNLGAYTGSTGEGSINSWAAAQNVIVVGAECVNNYKPLYFSSGTLGDPIDFSSFGTLVDGREMPHIIAPGSVILSSMSSYYYSYSQNYERYYQKSVNGKTYYWMPMQGTSMATPHMAGICALWLEADPTLTTADLISIAQRTAKPVKNPSKQAGAGIVDAYAGVKAILDMNAVNEVKTDQNKVMVRSLGGNVFETYVGAEAQVALVNLQGVTVVTTSTEDGTAIVDASSLPAGIYVLTVTSSNFRHAQKMVVR